jgi:hypothetical protein
VQAQLAGRVDEPIRLPGKHFSQEDFPQEIAEAVPERTGRPRKLATGRRFGF